MKSICPGASIITNYLLGVFKNAYAALIVIPLLLSSSSSSITKANWKLDLPYSLQSF
jgi:hypothetical protein